MAIDLRQTQGKLDIFFEGHARKQVEGLKDDPDGAAMAQERAAALEGGYDLKRVLDRDDLVAGEDVFFSATGITDGDVLQGVRYPTAGGATTESLVMRTRSGTVRRVRAQHDRAKLRAVSGERF